MTCDEIDVGEVCMAAETTALSLEHFQHRVKPSALLGAGLCCESLPVSHPTPTELPLEGDSNRIYQRVAPDA